MSVRISDIAKMAGVSVGTVDRVIHNRGQVSKDKKEKVERVLKEINYKPNMAARFLASNRRFTFKVIIPSYLGNEYWTLVNEGITKAKNEFDNLRIEIEYILFDQEDQSTFPVDEGVIGEQCDGVVIGPLFHSSAIKLSKILNTKNIPYIYIDSNVPQQKNKAFFGVDSFVGGIIAARFMMNEVGKDGDILIINVERHQKNTSTQKLTREEGFRKHLEENGFRGKIEMLELSLDTTDICRRQLIEIVSKSESKIGAIVFNSKIHRLSNLIADTPGLKNKIKLIGYDLIPSNMKGLENGDIEYIISQRPYSQGYESIKALSNMLVFGLEPTQLNYMPIDIVIKENLDFYNNYKL